MEFLRKLISFDEFITPSIIKGVYYVLATILIISGLVMLFSGSILSGLGIIILSPIFLKIYCEILIVLFKIYERLNDINKKLDQ